MNFELLKENLLIKAFGLTQIPLILACNPKLIEMSKERVRLELPLNWFTRNHHKSMYFGALCIGADVAGGLMAMKLIKMSGRNISFIFKDFQAEFLKRPEGHVEFVCNDVALVKALVQKAATSGERQFQSVKIFARVPSISNEEVAKFTLTISLKQKI